MTPASPRLPCRRPGGPCKTTVYIWLARKGRQGQARGCGRQEGRDARRVRSRLEEPSVRTLARRGRADGVEADEYRVVLEEALIN